MVAVIVCAHRQDLAAIETLRGLLPEGVSLIVQDTAPSTTFDDSLLSVSITRHETPPLLKLKNPDNPRAWYRRFERKSRK